MIFDRYPGPRRREILSEGRVEPKNLRFEDQIEPFSLFFSGTCRGKISVA
jgi:hypothetical protein